MGHAMALVKYTSHGLIGDSNSGGPIFGLQSQGMGSVRACGRIRPEASQVEI